MKREILAICLLVSGVGPEVLRHNRPFSALQGVLS
jgi:hypothetical protein